MEKLEKESKTSLDQLQDKLKDKEEIIKDLESNIKAKNSSNEKLREEYNEIKSLYESKTQMITSLQKEVIDLSFSIIINYFHQFF